VITLIARHFHTGVTPMQRRMHTMRDFHCPNFGQRLAFENSKCLNCGRALGYSLDEGALLVIARGQDSEHAGAVDAGKYRLSAEQAKRRLISELIDLRLPIIGRDEDPEHGLAFDLLSSHAEKVFTGHEHGLITLDLAEGDDVHREQLRIAMDEPYRTLLGHFRHEVGHYYYRLVSAAPKFLATATELFGDAEADYQEALDRHYSHGAPDGWENDYVSSYATMHPAEDWAETFAHYLHIRDTLDTSAAFGFAPAGSTFDRRMLGLSGFDTIIEMWLPLAWSLNMVNRSMGRDDLYPFVLPAPVLDKMRFIHTVIDEVTADTAKMATAGG
jgi:hypothetical protein